MHGHSSAVRDAVAGSGIGDYLITGAIHIAQDEHRPVEHTAAHASRTTDGSTEGGANVADESYRSATIHNMSRRSAEDSATMGEQEQEEASTSHGRMLTSADGNEASAGSSRMLASVHEGDDAVSPADSLPESTMREEGVATMSEEGVAVQEILQTGVGKRSDVDDTQLELGGQRMHSGCEVLDGCETMAEELHPASSADEKAERAAMDQLSKLLMGRPSPSMHHTDANPMSRTLRSSSTTHGSDNERVGFPLSNFEFVQVEHHVASHTIRRSGAHSVPPYLEHPVLPPYLERMHAARRDERKRAAINSAAKAKLLAYSAAVPLRLANLVGWQPIDWQHQHAVNKPQQPPAWPPLPACTYSASPI